MGRLPDPAIDRLRLLPKRVGGSRGTGERRARTTGAGMEFADYRPYQAGDDPRHIDPQVYQRFGTLNIRQFSASKQLLAVICIDATASMAFESGAKLDMAKDLAATLMQAALMGGDAVMLVAVAGEEQTRTALFSRRTDVVAALAWLDDVAPREGRGDVQHTLSLAAQGWPKDALVVMVSDFWNENNALLLQDLAQNGREVWAAQILTAAERRPQIESDGTLQVQDAETGEDVILPAAAVRDYIRALDGWNEALAKEAAGLGGQWITMTPNDPVMMRLLSAGWIG